MPFPLRFHHRRRLGPHYGYHQTARGQVVSHWQAQRPRYI